MVVEFNIPHGRMRIHAEGFFRDAGKMQIRMEKSEAARGSKASCKLVEKYGCILGYVDKILA